LTGWLLAACEMWPAADIADSCCCVSESLRTETSGVMLEIRGNMGQCNSEDQEL
jgi:hypothetical protein